MVEHRCGVGLSMKTCDSGRVLCQFGSKELDGDRPVQGGLDSRVDLSHATTADSFTKAVSVGQSLHPVDFSLTATKNQKTGLRSVKWGHPGALIALVALAGCQGTPGEDVAAWSVWRSIETAPSVQNGQSLMVTGITESGPWIGLWSGALCTDGVVAVEDVQPEANGEWWWFPVITPLGLGDGSVLLQDAQATMDLGGRAGEFVFAAQKTDLNWDGATRKREAEAVEADCRARNQDLVEGWQTGAFLLRGDSDAVVGVVVFRGDKSPVVSLFDATWMTDGPVVAASRDDGGDVSLVFPVEPSLNGEEGELRINVVTSAVVVPSGARPNSTDRVLRLSVGTVDESTEQALRAAAITEANERERGVVEAWGPHLAEVLTGDGLCLETTTLDSEWSVLLRGYAVTPMWTQGGCQVAVRPKREQHGRRFRGTFASDGLAKKTKINGANDNPSR